MPERSDIDLSQRVDQTPLLAPLRRRFSAFIKAALERWLAMAEGTTAASPRFPPF
jgi:hypothetical protein